MFADVPSDMYPQIASQQPIDTSKDRVFAAMGQEDPATVFFLGMKGLVPYSGLAVVLTYSKSIANSLGSCAFLIIIPTLVAFFFGGMGFNAFTWAVVFASLCNSSLGICCVCPCFAICALLMYLAVGLSQDIVKYVFQMQCPLHHFTQAF